jgi:hypothetical protein
MFPNKKDKLVTIDLFYDFLLANSAKKKLSDHNIISFLEDGSSLNRLAEIELKVFSKDVEAAFDVLSKETFSEHK